MDGNDIILDFQKQSGLLPVIAQEESSKEVLMLAYMNEEAFENTLKTGKATYYSRSRNKLWVKGESSGHQQIVKDIRIDCDNDTILLIVEQKGGAACHKGYKSCFHNFVEDGKLVVKGERVFDPKEVYKK